ncbi:lactonase family protein [Plastoroseomonas arctica]|uniref:Lactonase family protein n=1 Tax=Plastoroseomonas arctica TaxID=1509237 RepID=A0AAF1KJW8_9PROT|nr:lactonase family protein [Plastoroseomonas arctica]MBR0655950.1 lactonase family protein [Plastoroseomonas arctica]
MTDETTSTTSRRTLLAGMAMATPALSGTAAAQTRRPPQARPVFAYVGSFTSAQRRARGEGISVFSMNTTTGAWTHVQTLGDLVNPSFLVTSRDGRFLYSVHGDGDFASAFAIDPASGRIRALNRGTTGGRNGVRQAIDPSGKWLVVANYATGSVAVLPIRPDGSLGDHAQLVSLPGEPGPHRREQPNSEPHDVVFDPTGKYVVIPDKGVDRVFVFSFDPSNGALTPAGNNGFVASRSGAGPRHMAFHPTRPIAWVLNELDSTVTTCAWAVSNGTLTPQQVITTLPTDFTGNSTCAEIAVSADGRFVHVSNRGHDSVTSFAARADNGLLGTPAWTRTQGPSPRFIGLAPGGRFLYAANEQGDTILPFRVEGTGGRLTQAGPAILCKSPVTIAFTG